MYEVNFTKICHVMYSSVRIKIQFSFQMLGVLPLNILECKNFDFIFEIFPLYRRYHYNVTTDRHKIGKRRCKLQYLPKYCDITRCFWSVNGEKQDRSFVHLWAITLGIIAMHSNVQFDRWIKISDLNCIYIRMYVNTLNKCHGLCNTR